jgi:hypothetical protein
MFLFLFNLLLRKTYKEFKFQTLMVRAGERGKQAEESPNVVRDSTKIAEIANGKSITSFDEVQQRKPDNIASTSYAT